MAAGNDRLWRSVCTVVGHMEYFDDSRFTTTTSRAANQVALKDLLEEEFGRKPVDYWLAAFRDAGVPCTPINSYSQILSDPHVKQMGWVQDLKLPSGHETKTFISPVIFGDQQLGVRRPPPALGEHNDEILSEITGQ